MYKKCDFRNYFAYIPFFILILIYFHKHLFIETLTDSDF